MILLLLALLGQRTEANLIYDKTKYEFVWLDFNTSGWEDSAEIDSSGQILSYTYFPWDVVQFGRGTFRLSGPMDEPWPLLDSKNQPISVIYLRFTLDGQKFFPKMMSKWATPTNLDGCQHFFPNYLLWRSEDRALKKKLIKLGEFPTGKVYNIELGEQYDNPHLTDNKRLMLLDNGKDIYISHIRGNLYSWSAPTNANRYWKINTEKDQETQPYYYMGDIYFTRSYQQILRATPREATPIIGIAPGGPIVAIGEPSVCKRGIYMVCIYQDGENYDCDIIFLKNLAAKLD